MTTTEPRIPITELEPSARMLMACYTFGDSGGNPFRATMEDDVQKVFGVEASDAERLRHASGDDIIELLKARSDMLSDALGAVATLADTDEALNLAKSIPDLIERGCRSSTSIYLDKLCSAAMNNVLIEEV